MTRQSKKPANTRHRKAHGHVRRPLFANRKMIALGVLALVLAAGVFTGLRAVVVNWDGLMAGTQEFIARQIDARVKTVMVSGAVNAEPANLRQALSLKRGDSLVGFDAQAARQSLEALGWVKSAGVVRVLPSTVKVEITEYEPLARLEHGGTVWIIAPDGHLITQDYDDFEHLPVLRGKGAKENAAGLFALLADYPEMGEDVIAAVYVGERRWDIEFASGAIAKLPEDRQTLAMDYLRVLQNERDLLDVAEVMVDLRLPDKIVLRLPEGSDNNYL